MTKQFHITEYDEFAAKIEELRDIANFIPDASSEEGYDKSKRIHLDFRKVENAIEKARKDKKAYFIEGGKQVDSQAKKIMASIEELRLPHTKAYQEVDTKRKEREAKRKEELETRVQELRGLPELMRDSSSDEVKMALDSLQSEECTDFYEYTKQALEARNSSQEELRKMFGEKLKAEKDAAELLRLRKEAEERAQAELEEAIRKEAAEKAEREKAEAERREREAQEAALKADQEKLEAEKRAIESEKQRKLEAEQAKKRAAEEAEAAAKRAAEEAKAAAERARLEEVERQKAEELRIKQETEAREANKRHVGGIRKAAKEALMQYVDEPTAKKIILAINNGEIPAVSIAY